MAKPDICFCWWCGKKFWRNRHVKVVVDGHKRSMHKACSREAMQDEAIQNNAFGLEY